MPRSTSSSGPDGYPDGTMTEPWLPVEVDDVTIAFPAQIMHMLPPWALVDNDEVRYSEWENFANHWFSLGIPADAQFWLKDGIDGEAMVRHVRAVQGSFQPKHQHKAGGLAFLFSHWFRGVRIDSRGKAWGEPFEVDAPTDETLVETEG